MSTERKTLLSILASWPVRDLEEDRPRSFEPAIDLLASSGSGHRIDQALAEQVWSTAFAALLLFGFYVDGPQAERAIQQLRTDQPLLGEELPLLVEIVSLYDALTQDKRAKREGTRCTLKPTQAFETAEAVGTPGVLLVRELFVHRYNALASVNSRMREQMRDLEAELERIKQSAERGSTKHINALETLLYLLASHRSVKQTDNSLAETVWTEVTTPQPGRQLIPGLVGFEAIKGYIVSGRHLAADRRAREKQGR